jgi:hypothetical protein
MRIYDNASIKEELLTGFQSPCSEFADKPLSFDERYGVGNPALKLICVNSHFSHLGILKKDQLLVDESLRPKGSDLVVVMQDEEMTILKYQEIKSQESHYCAVIKVIIRSQYEK